MTEKTAFEKWWINNEYRFGQNPYHTASEAWNYQQQHDATVVISDRRNRKEYDPPWGDIDSIDYDCHNELLFLDAGI